MTTPNPIRLAIARAVADRGLSHAELARLAGMTRPQVSAYLAGKRDVNAATAGRMLAALGLEVKDGGDEAGRLG